MKKILNIVNGDAGIDIMKKAEIQGDFLPWDDFLHEGPVMPNLSLVELSKERAKFISDFGLGELKTISKSFQERDSKLMDYNAYEKIVLWFEHDLYDQLQLIQILDFFKTKDLSNIKLTLICTNNYLGESSVQQIQKILQYESDILPEHLLLASKAWSAFQQENPKEWFKLLEQPTSLLPFLKGAIFRMLEEFPNTRCGLSRTEYQALLIISNGIDDAKDIFIKCQSFEERKFMGDVIFWNILKDYEKYKIIHNHNKKLSITTLGKKLLNAEENWLNIKPLNRFIGGVHISNDNLWCWDIEKKTIKKHYFSKAINSLLIVK